jgi:hypothetical protein
MSDRRSPSQYAPQLSHQHQHYQPYPSAAAYPAAGYGTHSQPTSQNVYPTSGYSDYELQAAGNMNPYYQTPRTAMAQQPMHANIPPGSAPQMNHFHQSYTASQSVPIPMQRPHYTAHPSSIAIPYQGFAPSSSPRTPGSPDSPLSPLAHYAYSPGSMDGANNGTYPASPQRPYACDLCVLSFSRQHDLKRHRDTHSGKSLPPITSDLGAKQILPQARSRSTATAGVASTSRERMRSSVIR